MNFEKWNRVTLKGQFGVITVHGRAIFDKIWYLEGIFDHFLLFLNQKRSLLWARRAILDEI